MIFCQIGVYLYFLGGGVRFSMKVCWLNMRLLYGNCLLKIRDLNSSSIHDISINRQASNFAPTICSYHVDHIQENDGPTKDKASSNPMI